MQYIWPKIPAIFRNAKQLRQWNALLKHRRFGTARNRSNPRWSSWHLKRVDTKGKLFENKVIIQIYIQMNLPAAFRKSTSCGVPDGPSVPVFSPFHSIFDSKYWMTVAENCWASDN